MDCSLVYYRPFLQLVLKGLLAFSFKLAVVETTSPFLRLSAGLISKGLTVPNLSLKPQRKCILQGLFRYYNYFYIQVKQLFISMVLGLQPLSCPDFYFSNGKC